MSVANVAKGPRLEFALIPVKGETTRVVHVFNKDKGRIEEKEIKVPSGGFLYTPSGHVYYLTPEEIQAKGFDREPKVLNFDRITDPNTPAGRYKFAKSDKERQLGWNEMVKELVRFCEKKVGPMKKEPANAGS